MFEKGLRRPYFLVHVFFILKERIHESLSLISIEKKQEKILFGQLSLSFWAQAIASSQTVNSSIASITWPSIAIPRTLGRGTSLS